MTPATLRTLFTKRDRVAAQLANLDKEIAAATRELARQQGVAFLRPEAARRIAFSVDQEEAA